MPLTSADRSSVYSHPRNPETCDMSVRFFLDAANFDFRRAVERPVYEATYLGRAAGMMAIAVDRAEQAAHLRGHRYSSIAGHALWMQAEGRAA